jgi:hypothetical protein
MIHCRLKLLEAQAFIEEHHRHSKPLKRHMFSIGARENDYGPLLGVATIDNCSSAWSKRHDHAELRRLCTTGNRNVASFLISKCWKACEAMGIHTLITYTKPWESGASLKATGFNIQHAKWRTLVVTGQIRDGRIRWYKNIAGSDDKDRKFTQEVLDKFAGREFLPGA